MSRRSTPWDQYTVTESGLYLSDNTIADVSTSRHGLTPKLPNDASKFLDGTGAWTSPGTASGTGVIAPAGPKTPIVGGSWSTRNAGGTTYTTSSRDGSVNIRVPASATNAFRGQDKAVPSTPYTCIAALTSQMLVGNNIGYAIYFYNVAAAKAIAIQVVIVSNSLSWFVQLSDTSFGMTGTVYASGSLSDVPKFLALRDDGTTNKTYWIGEDEEHMVLLFTHGRTTDITPDRVGFFGNPRQASVDQVVTCLSWKEQAGSPA